MTINQQDFITPITGNIVIQNNGARLVLQSNADLNTTFEGDESFKLILRKGSPEGPIVATTPVILIRDTSNIKIYSSLVSNLPQELMVDSNANVIFTLRTVNISSADTLYYYTTGNVTSSNFVQGNTGSINLSVSQGLGIANILLTTTDIPANETRVFQLNIADTPLGTPKITSNTINIFDSNLVELSASGGSITTSGGFRTHVFTSSGNFTVSGTGIGPKPVQYLIVAGGGGGGATGGGGGAGGFRTGTVPAVTAGTTYVITVGGGGAGGTFDAPGANRYGRPGNNSAISVLNITSTAGGGGGGGSSDHPSVPAPLGRRGAGADGGSGGGNAYGAPKSTGGAGIPGQGFPGGGGFSNFSGGGGAGSAGGTIPNSGIAAAGSGSPSSITGTSVTYAVGGRGNVPLATRNSGTTNRGTAGDGTAPDASIGETAGAGGSGIVVLRYPYSG